MAISWNRLCGRRRLLVYSVSSICDQKIKIPKINRWFEFISHQFRFKFSYKILVSSFYSNSICIQKPQRVSKLLVRKNLPAGIANLEKPTLIFCKTSYKGWSWLFFVEKPREWRNFHFKMQRDSQTRKKNFASIKRQFLLSKRGNFIFDFSPRQCQIQLAILNFQCSRRNFSQVPSSNINQRRDNFEISFFKFTPRT